MRFSKVHKGICTAVLFLSYPNFPFQTITTLPSMIKYLMSLFLANYVWEAFRWSHAPPPWGSLLAD